jgi:hypothetical protein
MAEQSRVTQAGVYVSEEGDNAKATKAGIYVAYGPPEEARATVAGIYVAYGRLAEARVTTAGTYASLTNRIERQCVTIWYNDFNVTPWTFGMELITSTTRKDITQVCDTEPVYLHMLANYNLTMGGKWSKELDDMLGPDMISGQAFRRVQIRIEMPPHYVVWYEWSSAQLQRYGIDAGLSIGVEWGANLIFQSAPKRTADC